MFTYAVYSLRVMLNLLIMDISLRFLVSQLMKSTFLSSFLSWYFSLRTIVANLMLTARKNETQSKHVVTEMKGPFPLTTKVNFFFFARRQLLILFIDYLNWSVIGSCEILG